MPALGRSWSDHISFRLLLHHVGENFKLRITQSPMHDDEDQCHCFFKIMNRGFRDHSKIGNYG